MSAQSVPEAQPADVVSIAFTERELLEVRRGLVHRLTVANANLRDKRNPGDYAAWAEMRDACWAAYRKIGCIPATTHEPDILPARTPVIMDEHEYLTRKPD